jgi:hypothetical protein
MHMSAARRRLKIDVPQQPAHEPNGLIAYARSTMPNETPNPKQCAGTLRLAAQEPAGRRPLVAAGHGRQCPSERRTTAALRSFLLDPASVQGRNPEFNLSNEVRTGFISGATFKRRQVQYNVVSGRALFEGDIVIGPLAELTRGAVVITGSSFRWPGKQIPYCIQRDLPNPARITAAIREWETKTPIRLRPHLLCNARRQGPLPVNMLTFVRADGCWSEVGYQRRPQKIGLADACSTGSVVHEIGHTAGLWHEQSREDRDSHIEIHWENIKPTESVRIQFTPHITDGDDIGQYDFGSIMHYPAFAWEFAVDPSKPVISTKPPGIPIGQRNGLSVGDVAAVKALYP